MAGQNIAVKLCGVLQAKDEGEVTAREWRLVGQEQDGSQILTWISTKNGNEVMNVGVYTHKSKTLEIVHTFEEKLNIIQASVNSSRSLLVYVVKVGPTEDCVEKEAMYCPFLISLLPDKVYTPEEVEEGSTKQIMLQFVYGKSNKYSPGIRNDRFLLFKHLECIKIYRSPLFLNECDDGTEKWGFDGIYPEPETIVNIFSWAQWDCVNQVLFYIHYRPPTQSFAEGEEVKSPSELTPTLSALQFHADLPHETVLNIPLSLPHVPGAHGAAAACGSYEDDPIPLRVHDCSLDLYIVCDQRGLLCVCHHYLYKPLDDSTSSLVLDDVDLKDSGVNFAYSVTLLHHGCVVHSVVPDLPWSLAKSLRPSYTLYNDNHLLVNIPMLFTHIIDISPHHEPCCHIVIPMDPSDSGPSLAPLHGWGPHTMVDLNTLDVVTMGVSEKDLTSTFKSDTVIENKLAIMHYVIQHEGNMDLAEELISWLCLHQHDGLGGLQRVMQEYLIGTTYAVTRRSLPASAVALMNWLPFTLHLKFADVKAGSASVCVSVCALWRGAAAAVVLAPRQRVSQFAEDAWTRLWAALCALAAPRNRLRPDHVRERLAVTLHCYQPEALSRCSTPMSPTGPPIPTRRPSLVAQDSLPFMELDVCTTSKQEHVIAANLRAVSVHLMTESSGGNSGALESGVHALATRWAAAQLDAARALCRAAVRAVGAVPQPHQTRGFPFIDDMDATHALVLFKVLEQYYVATDSIAFPLPQGFSSFFTYLGHRALPFSAFVQYVHRNVFELQIDVLKAIVASRDDDDKRAVDNKLRLIQIVGEARGRRALAAWPSRTALVLRARDHAAALLSGVTAPARDHAPHRPVKDTGETRRSARCSTKIVGEARGRRALAAWPSRTALVLRARDHAAALLSGVTAPARDHAPHRPVKDTGETRRSARCSTKIVGEARGRRALAAWPSRTALVLRARDHAAALLSGVTAPARDHAPHRPVKDTGETRRSARCSTKIVGEARGRRALAAWPSRTALVLRARDHAAALLSGVTAPARDHAPHRPVKDTGETRRSARCSTKIVGEARGRRALAAWPSRTALVLRARDHAAALLSGVTAPARDHAPHRPVKDTGETRRSARCSTKIVGEARGRRALAAWPSRTALVLRARDHAAALLSGVTAPARDHAPHRPVKDTGETRRSARCSTKIVGEARGRRALAAWPSRTALVLRARDHAAALLSGVTAPARDHAPHRPVKDTGETRRSARCSTKIVGEARGRRALAAWPSRTALVLRARDHAAALLSGVTAPARDHAPHRPVKDTGETRRSARCSTKIVGEARGRRALAAWPSRTALVLRARDHAAALLSGVTAPARDHAPHRPVKDTGETRRSARCSTKIVGEARGRRALAAWPSRTALVLRARDHAAALLSGVTAPARDHAPHRPVKDTGETRRSARCSTKIVGEARGRRALAAWPSRTALVLRARDHAAALLSGVTAPARDHAPHRPVKDTGLAALPSGERLSPLDTFLDLLTAKASLNELDFNLIIEATLASVQQEINA